MARQGLGPTSRRSRTTGAASTLRGAPPALAGQPERTDLSIWVIAFDGDEVAGGILNAIDADQNAALGLQRGWLGGVFTRRAWRRRGLATALIAESLRLLRDRGMTSAGLGVDADNPSGALGLYEGLGFAVDSRSTAWRRPFSWTTDGWANDAPGARLGRPPRGAARVRGAGLVPGRILTEERGMYTSPAPTAGDRGEPVGPAPA